MWHLTAEHRWRSFWKQFFLKCSTHKEVERVIVQQWNCIIHNHKGTVQIYTLCTFCEYLLWFIPMYLGGRREFTWQDNMSLGGEHRKGLTNTVKILFWCLTVDLKWNAVDPSTWLSIREKQTLRIICKCYLTLICSAALLGVRHPQVHVNMSKIYCRWAGGPLSPGVRGWLTEYVLG